MKPSPVSRILFALSVVGTATTSMAQAPGSPLPTAESRAAASAVPPSAPGAAPAAATPRPAAEPAKPEVLDPAAEAERKKAEAALREKRELARKKTELDNRCVIKQAMSDAEIAKCR